jgi:hypothetical protein
VANIVTNEELDENEKLSKLNELLQNVDEEIGRLSTQRVRIDSKLRDLKRPHKVDTVSGYSPSRKKKEKLHREVELLNIERKEVTEKLLNVDEIISLNVGGTIYVTTKSTLLKYPGTMLSSMFSGGHSVTKDKDGNYYLDRDGVSFSYILNYLRTGQFPQLSRKELLELREEAEFYAISPLLTALDNTLETVILSKFAVLRYNENNNYNNLSWQGMTEPCNLKIGQNLYKCIDDVLTEVDSRGWELMQLGGDGNAEGGWKYVFKKKPSFNRMKNDYKDGGRTNTEPITERLKVRREKGLSKSAVHQRIFRRKRSDSF